MAEVYTTDLKIKDQLARRILNRLNQVFNDLDAIKDPYKRVQVSSKLLELYFRYCSGYDNLKDADLETMVQKLIERSN